MLSPLLASKNKGGIKKSEQVNYYFIYRALFENNDKKSYIYFLNMRVTKYYITYREKILFQDKFSQKF